MGVAVYTGLSHVSAIFRADLVKSILQRARDPSPSQDAEWTSLRWGPWRGTLRKWGGALSTHELLTLC